MNSGRQWDLVVVGAGPAGASAAVTARQRGLSTLVLEAARFPRHHVGESLVRLWTVFDTLGVLDQMEQTFQHKYGSGRIWGTTGSPQWTTFDEGDQRPYSLQVRRSQFDAILAGRAAALGADVRFGWRAVEPLVEGTRVVGLRARDDGGRPHDIHARFVIDASGRTGFLARRFKLRQADPFYPNLSVYAYLRGVHRFPGSHEGNLFIESVPLGWFWFIPLRDGEVSVGLVCDRDSRPELRRLGPAEFLRMGVRSSSVIAQLLRDASYAGPTRVVGSGGYSARAFGGPGWFLVGDAGSFVDPMWATAVANSMRDGIRAAAAVHGALSENVNDAEAVEFHDRYSVEQDRGLHEIVKYVYGINTLHRQSAFWQGRHTRLTDRPELLRGRGLGWLAKDPAVQYFRSAFMGMGVRPEAVAELDGRLADLDRRRRDAQDLARGSLDRWVPRWSPGWEPQPAVGMDAAGTVRRGLEIGPGEERMFCADPLVSTAFGLVDGRRDVATVIKAAAAQLNLRVGAVERIRLLAAMRTAHAEGAITD